MTWKHLEPARANPASASSPSDLAGLSSGSVSLPSSTSSQQLPNDLGDKHCCPKKPILPDFPSRLFGKTKRAFSTYYYNKYCWLEYSVLKDAVFCFACRHFQTDSSVEESFRKGVSDWKKLSSKLEKHANSLAHQNCMVKWDNFKQSTSGGGSIAAKLSESHNATVEKNRSYLFKVVDIVRLLSALGLPFRGHREAIDSESRGNYLEVCKFFSKYDPDFQSMQSNYFNATSPDFQNEIIEICANLVCAEIAEKVQDTGFFAVIADEARSSHTEQLSVCLRYTEQLEIKERFLCFIDCSASRNAAGIVDTINTGLEICGLKNIPIVAQSYDGASVMSGQVSGVQQHSSIKCLECSSAPALKRRIHTQYTYTAWLTNWISCLWTAARWTAVSKHYWMSSANCTQYLQSRQTTIALLKAFSACR